ncbi:MAG: hypothetical protein Q7O12_05715 [Deltaproteobacteria bacterium]|nr:hypothetical protein [Deltaproteobacteria bacterium]
MPGCAACRQELAELRQVIAALEAAPVPDPAPEFWGEFSRDLHLKLVQAAQEGQAAPEATSSRWFRLPYLLGAPAVAVLLLYVAVQLTGPGAPIQNQAVVMHLPSPTPAQDQAPVKRESAAKMAAVPQKSAAPPAAEVAAPPALPMEPMEQFVTVALEDGAPLPVEEADISAWDLDAELAGMTDQEKHVFLNNMHQRKKDGSCVEGFSFCSWG